MNFDRLNQFLTLIANVGVVAGLFFVAIQIQQDVESTQAQIQVEMANNQLWIVDTLADPENRTIFDDGQSLSLEQSSAEYGRYSTLVVGMFIVWENEWYQYERGYYTPEAFSPQTERWKGILQSPGARQVWSNGRNRYSIGFVSLVDSIIEGIENGASL